MYFPLHACVPIGKEKATAATVAILGALQRSINYQNSSTKVLSVQGQSNQKIPKPHKLDSIFGNNGG
jgi:hypothetical protein